MTKVEKIFANFIEKQVHKLFLIIIVILNIIVRYSERDFYSGDMWIFLLPWCDYYKENGFVGLASGIGDYNLLYQTILLLFTKININSMYLIKIFSSIFDFCTAFFVAEKICKIRNERRFGLIYNIVVSVFLYSPTILIDSSVWGQCDSIYCFFVILFIIYLYEEKNIRAFIFLGIAFSFKLQSIFIIPFVILYYFRRKSFSAFQFIISIFVFWMSGIVAYINGRSLTAAFGIYFRQVGNSSKVNELNIHSFWNIGTFSIMKCFCMIIFAVICGIGVYYVMSKRKSLVMLEDIIRILSWFLWAGVLFLPDMHDRYTYLLDAFLIIGAFLDHKLIKYAICSNLLSLITYIGLLSELLVERQQMIWCSLLYFAVWCYYTYYAFSKLESEEEYNQETKIDLK